MCQPANVRARLDHGSVVCPTSGCWVWQRRSSTSGYGVLTVRVPGLRHPVPRYVHRLSYEATSGKPIPKDMTLDHLCKNTLCLNPDHLELVSASENSRRRWERA